MKISFIKQLSFVVLVGLFVSPSFAEAKEQNSCCKKDCLSKPLKLRVVSKNMLFGAEPGEALGENEGFDPVLPSLGDTLELAYQTTNLFTERDLARTFENIWQQANSEDLLGTRSRLDAMAMELASVDADIICLQECSLIGNSPLTYPDGSVRQNPYQLNNGFYGKEDSPEFARTFDFARMIIQRLKDNHNQEFEIVSQVITDGAQAKRTLNNVEDAEAILSLYLTNVTLVRKSLHVEVMKSREFTYNREALPAQMILGNDPEGSDTIEVEFNPEFRRGYVTNDLMICGQPLRIIATELATGNNFSTVFVTPTDTKIMNSPAARAAQALQLLREEIIPSPYPVVLVGGLNIASITEQAGSQIAFGVGAWETLVGSVDAAGSPTDGGGVMVDSCRAVHGDACFGPGFRTASLSGSPDWESMRDPNTVYRVRIDHILFRHGDGVKATKFDLTQPTPFTPTAQQQWAWTSDHNGIWAELCIKRTKCSKK